MATLATELVLRQVTDPVITPGDRLGMTLFVAVAVHALVILGVVFVPHDSPNSLRSTLDIILVQQRSESPPEEVDFLAQANQTGGGEHTEKARPATPLLAPLTGPQPEVVAAAPPSTPAEPVPLTKPEPLEPAPAQEPLHSVIAVNVPDSERAEKRSSVLPKPSQKPAVVPEALAGSDTEPTATQSIKAADLISRSLAMASLSAEIDQRLEAYAQRPRRKWISARTREYRYASYMEAWRLKVERIGNLNYPDEARRNRLSGHLLLEVALNSNGTISDVILRRTSGHRMLDDAAIRIVKLAAPFAPFPRDILEETDILHIERTWRFLSSSEFSSR